MSLILTETEEFVRRLRDGADELERAAQASEEDVTQLDATSATIPLMALRRIAASFVEAACTIEQQAAELAQLRAEDSLMASTLRKVRDALPEVQELLRDQRNTIRYLWGKKDDLELRLVAAKARLNSLLFMERKKGMQVGRYSPVSEARKQRAEDEQAKVRSERTPAG